MREDVLDAVDAPAPERFEIVEQAMGGPQRRDIAAHALLPAVAGLGDEPRALPRSYVLVHRSEADRTPDANKRKGARPGWDGGLYAFMRRALAPILR